MSTNKIGRNAPCPCGSGVKYKRCHLGQENRENQENPKTLKPWDLENIIKKAFSYECCLVPKSMRSECSAKIIKAHTISKSSLKAIATNGHILGYKLSIIDYDKTGKKLNPKKMGVNKASTFKGFCSNHDSSFFSCIENGEKFDKTEEQCFKLAYRAFVKEKYIKEAISNFTEKVADDVHRQSKDNLFVFDFGNDLAIKDNNFHKEKFDWCIDNNRFSDIRAFIVEYSELFPIQVSGGNNPDFDFKNTLLQDLNNFSLTPDILELNSFYDGANSYIVLSWLKNSHKTCSKFIKSLLTKPNKDLSTYLVQYMFNSFENLFISPKWWNSISKDSKNSLMGILNENLSQFIEPNGDGIAEKLISTDLPQPSKIDYINW